MINCKISFKDKLSAKGLSIKSNADYDAEENGKKDVLKLNKDGAYIGIDEKKLAYDGNADYIQFDLMLNDDTLNKISLLSGSYIPFSITLHKTEYGYVFQGDMLTVDGRGNEYHRTITSINSLQSKTWYTIKVLIFLDEYYVIVDDTVWLRRIYNGAMKNGPEDRFTIGNSSGKSMFSIANVAISRDIYDENDVELENLLSLASTEQFMVLENCYEDCLMYGYDLGQFKSKNEKNNPKEYIYDNGAIVWVDGEQPIFLNQDLFGYYNNNKTDCGNPIEATFYTSVDNAVIFLALFENCGVFSIRRNTGARNLFKLSLQITSKFLEFDLDEQDFWYPTTTGTYSFGEQATISYCLFSNKMYIYEYEGNCNILSASISKAWFKFLNIAGNPISDYDIYLDSEGNTVFERIQCRKGSIYYSYAWNTSFFTEKELGKIKSNEIKTPIIDNNQPKNISSYDFENGILINYPDSGKVVIHDSFLFRFKDVTTGKIDDGTNKTAELYLKLNFYINGNKVVDNIDLGNHSYSNGSSNYIFEDGNAYKEYKIHNISSSTSFRFFIQIYDYDPESENDYLGSFDYTYDITNGWGIDQYCQNVPVTQGMHTSPMTHQGSDNECGLENNHVTYFIGEDYNLDELKKNVRKNLAFPFNNHEGRPTKFDYEDFVKLFKNANHTGEWWQVGTWIHWLDHIFYKVCDDALDGAKCFGFALAELLAIHGRGFILPLSNYEETPEVWDELCKYYLYQNGWDQIMWMWYKMWANEYLLPKQSLPSIKSRIDREEFCILTLHRGNLTGHEVLCYGYEGDQLTIADCNRAYSEGENNSPVSTVTASTYHAYVNYNYNTTNSSVEYRYLCEMPYSIASKTPRVPNVADIICDGLLYMLAGRCSTGISLIVGGNGTSDIIYDIATGINPTKVIPLSGLNGDSSEGLKAFIIKDNHVEIVLQGSDSDNVECLLQSRGTTIEINSKIKKGESLRCSLKNIHHPHKMEISLIKPGEPTNVKLGISHFNGTFTHKFETEHKITANPVIFKKKTFGQRLCKIEKIKDVKGPEKISLIKSNIVKQDKSDRNLYIQPKRRYPGANIMNDELSEVQKKKLYLPAGKIKIEKA